MTELLAEAEAKLIGILAQHPDVFIATSDRIKAENFLNPTYRLSYDVMRDIYVDGGQVELSTLMERVAAKTDRSCVVDILRAFEEGVTPASTDWAIEQVLNASKRRYLQQALSSLLKKSQTAEDPQEVFSELLAVAVEGSQTKGEVHDGAAQAKMVFKTQADRKGGDDTIQGYRTGFASVDAHLGGLVPGRMTIISGPSGHGKTGLICNWLTQICVMNRIPGLFVSLEMSHMDVLDRAVSIISGATLQQVQSGATNSGVMDAIDSLHRGALHVTDNHPRDINDMVFLAERYARVHGVKVVALDYIGELVRDNIRQKEDRDERYARWVKTIRDAAKRLNVHVIILAQVNYEGALAESKKMGHIADHYLHFWREGADHYLECRKNRFGPSGYTYKVEYDRQTQRMFQHEVMLKSEGEK